MSLFPFFKSTPQLSRFPVAVEPFDVILQFDDLQSLVLPLGGLLNLLCLVETISLILARVIKKRDEVTD